MIAEEPQVVINWVGSQNPRRWLGRWRYVYVVGTLVIVFARIALYQMGHSGTATYHSTR